MICLFVTPCISWIPAFAGEIQGKGREIQMGDFAVVWGWPALLVKAGFIYIAPHPGVLKLCLSLLLPVHREAELRYSGISPVTLHILEYSKPINPDETKHQQHKKITIEDTSN